MLCDFYFGRKSSKKLANIKEITYLVVIQSKAKNLDNINDYVIEILHYTSFRSE